MARTPLRLVGHFTISVVCQLYWDYTLPFVVGKEQHFATSQSAPSQQPAHPNATTPQHPQQPQQQIITTNCVLAYACFSTLVLWQVLLWSSVAFLRYLDECHRTGVCVKWLGVNGKLKAPDKHGSYFSLSYESFSIIHRGGGLQVMCEWAGASFHHSRVHCILVAHLYIILTEYRSPAPA